MRTPFFVAALLTLVSTAVAAGTMGCGGADAGGSSVDALYAVPTQGAAGEARTILLSDVPARSREAAARARGEGDAVIATWHVHHVTTDDGFAATLVYGADTSEMVRLALVLGDDDSALSVIEPDADTTIEPPLSALESAPQTALGADRLQWFSDELTRLSDLTGATYNGADGTGVETMAVSVSRKCVARLVTMGLAIASNFVLSPAVGLFISAAESAAWGDYENATIVGATGAAAAGSAIMRASPIELLQKTGKVVSTLGKAGGIGMLGLVGVTLVFDPKLVVTAATPPQCTGS